jgi:hypothetical protein
VCEFACVCVCVCVCVSEWFLLRYVSEMKQNKMDELCSMQSEDENVLINSGAKIWIEELTLGPYRPVEE